MHKFLFSSLAGAIALAAQSVYAAENPLEQVNVTGSRVEIPSAESGVSVSVLTAVEIEQLGYSTLLDVVKTLPGIAVSNNGGLGKVSNVYVRGESGSRTLVLLDGVNVADPTNTQVTTQFQHLLASDVERIEVLRGPQGMMYGAGAGGVINIITKRAEQPLELQLSGETGRYNTQRAQAALRGQQAGWNYALNLSQLDSDGFNTRESDTTGERDGYDNRSVSARLGYAFSENFSVDGQIRQIDAETEYDSCFALVDPNDCLDLYTQTSYQLGADIKGAYAAHNVSVSSQELERDSLTEGVSSYAVEGRIDELNYAGNLDLDAGAISWGMDLDQQEIESVSDSQSLDILGVYGEWRGDVASKVYYTVGYRHDSLEDENHDSWRVSAAVPQLIGDNQQIKYRASASTGFRAPSPYEVSTNLVSEVAPLGPETSRGYELGVEYRYADLLQLEVVAFQQTVTDAIVYVSGIGTGWGAYAQDDGESDSDGLELSLSGKLGERGRWYANGTWLDSEDSAGEQRLNVPQTTYNLGASYTLLEERLSISGNWRHLADRNSPSTVYLEPAVALQSYNRLDLNAKYAFSERLAFTLRGENLLDEDYQEVAGFHTTGAAVYAGIQYTLR
ncbi:TonB-dependent receptor plug domain-containing protein [Microbulbifer celer]|uniref:TonB-dependent receptor plug domain-containing protein n=1 Tax=Microbulbifer celer TaxID=435905 RepID=A0ABW3UA88_9GAMM|nr:TonB-dependent receptor [Microbulbifer celer]UFN56512.1 TonB-dependent receptor [Microbulbifer celer]